jgi:protein-tyrosine phosphatase
MASEPSACTPVTRGLYVGPFLYARSRSWLRRHAITHVLNCTTEAPNRFPAELEYLTLRLEDSPRVSLSAQFDRCARWMDRAIRGGGAVLVHCQMGKSRSVTLAAAFLMWSDHLDGRSGAARPLGWQQALARVRRARPQARPNCGFLQQLSEYERTLAAQRDGFDELHTMLSRGVRELCALRGPLTPAVFGGSSAGVGGSCASGESCGVAETAGTAREAGTAGEAGAEAGTAETAATAATAVNAATCTACTTCAPATPASVYSARVGPFEVFVLSLDPFLPHVRAHSSHISPLNSFFEHALLSCDGRLVAETRALPILWREVHAR